MPLPRISIQPVRLHSGQPAPLHLKQRMSTSALGSVYGKKLGTEADLRPMPNSARGHRAQRALQVGERDALADDQAFDLVKHRRVRQVEIVLAIHRTDRDEPHRRIVAAPCAGSASRWCACAAAYSGRSSRSVEAALSR